MAIAVTTAMAIAGSLLLAPFCIRRLRFTAAIRRKLID